MGKMKSQEQFEAEVLDRLGPDYKVLGKYTGRDNHIEMIHYVCGNAFLKRPHDVVNKKSGCPYCFGNKPAKYNEKYVIENIEYPYKYIKGYQGFSKKCTFYCEKCNSEFEQTPRRIIVEKIYGCNCCVTKKKTHQEFLDTLGEETLKEYEVLEEYVNIDSKIQFKHKVCDTIFSLTPYQFVTRHKKQYCPICYYKKSGGEITIAKFLEENQIDYQKEFIFPDLPRYRYDFFVPSFNMVLEFDGAQHFYPINFFGGQKGFEEQQKRDQVKNQYCLNHNITILRIPYNEIDYLNQILYQIFKEKSSTTIEKFKITK